MNLRLPFSVDHQRKRTRTVDLPFEVYLMFVTSPTFVEVLPEGLSEKYQKTRTAFEKENRFLSRDYHEDYLRNPFIRLLTGPEIQKFFCKLLSLNYQAHREILSAAPGSFEEYFADLDLFWNETYKTQDSTFNVAQIRSLLFCQACLLAQHQRVCEKQNLRQKLDDFARAEIEALEARVAQVEREKTLLEQEMMQQSQRLSACKDALKEEQQKKLVLVPKDPYHMLGLESGHDSSVERRAKTLMKALHPDVTGTNDTAYLFEMVLRARDMITKD